MNRKNTLRKMHVLFLLVLLGQVAGAQNKKEQIATLSARVDSLSKENASLQSKASQMNAKIEQLSSQKDLLHKRMADTVKVCANQRTRIANLIHEKNELKTKLTQEKSELEQKLNESERKRSEAIEGGMLQMGPNMMNQISLDNYQSMFEIQVYNCDHALFPMDGRYQFYRFEDCDYGVMVKLNKQGKEEEGQRRLCSFSFHGACCSGLNQFAFFESGTLVVFNAGHPLGEIPTELTLNHKECRMKMLKRIDE